jgi:thiamine pyrophosphate-dependent acetolactate synthase large subunit-like protein
MRAYEVACKGRLGPVYLDVPEDVLEGNAEANGPPAPTLPQHQQAEPRQVEEVARSLLGAARPLIILGDGIRWSFSPHSLRRLVEQGGIPFITTPMARGFLPDNHPLCANEVRRWIQSQADFVLMAGACFDWRFRFGGELAKGVRIVQVDVEQANLGLNVPAALTACADSGLFLNRLWDVMSGRSYPTQFQPWQERVLSACVRKRRERESWLMKKSTPMGPQQLFGALRDFLPAEAVVVIEGNVTLSAGQAVLAARTPCSWLHPGWNGCMGSGIPFGMGAKLAAPERMVVVVCGDFGFGLSAMDLETAVRHRIPILVVIANNSGITGSAM